MKNSSALAFAVAVICSGNAIAMDSGAISPRTSDPISTRARDAYGDKTLAELNNELALMKDDLEAVQDDYRRHYERLSSRISRIKSIIQDRESALDFIRREGTQRYFTVRVGKLRPQLEELRFALGLQTIRFAKNIPLECDWRFDSSFQIDKSNPQKALEAFFYGLPLLPQVHERDRSATINALEVIKCD